jgi:hypothetical protein
MVPRARLLAAILDDLARAPDPSRT